MTAPNLDRRWTLTDAVEALWAQGIRIVPQAGGYRLNFITGGTMHTEYVTDDLTDALMAGFRMAKHPPAPPKERRTRRKAKGAYFVGADGVAQKRRKKRQQRIARRRRPSSRKDGRR